MESFNPFDFLKTLLSANPENTENTNGQSAHLEEPTFKNTTPPTVSGESAPRSDDAILRFMQAHEERAKRIRK